METHECPIEIRKLFNDSKKLHVWLCKWEKDCGGPVKFKRALNTFASVFSWIKLVKCTYKVRNFYFTSKEMYKDHEPELNKTLFWNKALASVYEKITGRNPHRELFWLFSSCITIINAKIRRKNKQKELEIAEEVWEEINQEELQKKMEEELTKESGAQIPIAVDEMPIEEQITVFGLNPDSY